MKTMAFIGIPEVDINTLLRLPDKDLFNACQTNIYATQLCGDDYFWRRRISLYVDDKYIDKPEDISWRDWYFFWRNNYPDPIGNRLNLDPYQAMIRIITEDDVVIGSEAYQNISLTLLKAFQSQDPEVVTHFMIQLEKIKELLFNLDLLLEHPLLNYADVISAAFENGFIKEATRLLDLLVEDIERLIPSSYYLGDFEDYNKIIQTIGRLGMITYFDQDLPDHLPEGFLEPEVVIENFIIGLVEGGYLDEAYQRLDKYLSEGEDYENFNFYDLYSKYHAWLQQ